jgi:AcrR family transcriptional regulator
VKFVPDDGHSGSSGSSEAGLSPSVLKILSGALDAIAARGASRLSMSDIIEASGVSRGTLYRYFSNKDDVLAAVAEYVCTGFENGIAAAAKGIEDPVERFRRVMQFYSRYTNENSPDRVFEVEPRFHLAFFRSRFGRYKTAVADALGPVFDHLDATLGQPVDRSAFVEALVRLQLSTLLVPADESWTARWNQSHEVLESWAVRFARQYT